MNAIPTLVKNFVMAATISAMLPIGYACAMPDTVQDAAIGFQTANYSPDEFIGFWEEEKEGDSRLTVTPAEKGWYGIEISWPRNKHQVDMWTMTAKPTGNHIMQYTDCKHYLLTFGQQYIEKEELLYQDGTGSVIMIDTKKVAWLDDQDHRADDTAFVPLKSPLGGGL